MHFNGKFAPQWLSILAAVYNAMHHEYLWIFVKESDG
jgi:hypothetical protein